MKPDGGTLSPGRFSQENKRFVIQIHLETDYSNENMPVIARFCF
jgi:hypothetical protein